MNGNGEQAAIRKAGYLRTGGLVQKTSYPVVSKGPHEDRFESQDPCKIRPPTREQIRARYQTKKKLYIEGRFKRVSPLPDQSYRDEASDLFLAPLDAKREAVRYPESLLQRLEELETALRGKGTLISQTLSVAGRSVAENWPTRQSPEDASARLNELLREARKSIEDEDEIETHRLLAGIRIELTQLRDEYSEDRRRNDAMSYLHEAVVFTPPRDVTATSIEGFEQAILMAFGKVTEEVLDRIVDVLEQADWELVPVEKVP